MLASILTFCVLSFGVLDDTDTIPKRFYIGYDQGISFRLFQRNLVYRRFKNFGCGLTIQNAGDGLYTWSESDSRSGERYSIYNRHSKSKNVGVRLLVDGYYRRKIGTIFWITPYVSLGGSYSILKRSYINSQINISTGTPYRYTDNKDTITKAFIGRAGVMPGIQLGRFQIEIKLGLQGSVNKFSSPEDIRDTETGKTKDIRLMYPTDFIRSLIVHMGF